VAVYFFCAMLFFIFRLAGFEVVNYGRKIKLMREICDVLEWKLTVRGEALLKLTCLKLYKLVNSRVIAQKKT
jgi:hypothetical protein